MRYRFLLAIVFIAASSPAHSQQNLDRVNPARLEDQSLEKISEETDNVPQLVVEEEIFTENGGRTEVAAAQPDLSYDVGAIDIVGLQGMSRSAFSDIVGSFIGRSLTSDDLASLTDQIARRARQQYPMASAAIEPQALRAGVLRVRIDEGLIDEIRLDGVQNSAVMAALQPLASGQPVTTAQLERRLLIAGDIDGISLGETRIERQDGKTILLVKVGHDAFRAQITFDNDSSKPLGPLELFGTARFNGVLAADDSLQIFALNTVPQLSELSFARLRYGKRVSPGGTEISLTGSYSRNAPGAYLEAFDIEGESWFAAIGALHPLKRSRQTSLWLDASLSYREIAQRRTDILARKDRLTVARLGLYGYTDLAGGRLRINTSLAQGLDLFGATKGSNPLSSRDDADGTFTTITFFADWKKEIVSNFGTNIAVRSQLASQPLLVSEEMGIGGASFVRGYDYSERSGDQSVTGYFELNYDWKHDLGVVRGLEFYAFADGGKAMNLEGGFGSGTLFSTGGGIRADVNSRTDAGLEIAVPLSGDRYDTDNQDPRIRFAMTRYF